jgi:hypothetical protein
MPALDGNDAAFPCIASNSPLGAGLNRSMQHALQVSLLVFGIARSFIELAGDWLRLAWE